MTHTPGPWNVSKAGIDRLIYADSEHAFDLAIVRDGGPTGEVDANARLIAAAPALLAACEAALGTFENLADADDMTETDHDNWELLREAIAAAKGGV